MKNIFIALLLLMFVNVSAVGVINPHNECKTKIETLHKADVSATVDVTILEVSADTAIISNHAVSIDVGSKYHKSILKDFSISQGTDAVTNSAVTVNDVGKVDTSVNKNHLYLTFNKQLPKLLKSINNKNHVIPDNYYLFIANNTSYRLCS